MEDVPNVKVDEESFSSKTLSEKIPNSLSIDEKKIVQKLDFLFVMPFIFVSCILKFISKATLTFAAVLGIISDTHITHNQFGFTGAIFFIGILVAQAPCSLLIQKVSLKKYLAVIVTVSGMIVALTAISTKFLHLVIFQFILGMFQASVPSCCVMIISRMYRRSEQARRLSFFVFGDGMGMILGGLVGYGVGHMNDIEQLRPWQWLMILFGSFTVLFGIFCFFLMADNPKSKLLALSPEQEQIADLRTLDNAVVASKKVNYAQIKECLKESRYYCYVLVSILINLQNGAIQIFSSVMVHSFGFSKLNTILLSIPAGIYIIVVAIIGGWFVGRYGHMHYTMCVSLSIASIGLLLIVIPDLHQARLIGVYLCTSFSLALILIFSSIASNVSGYTKKIFYLGSVSAASTIGCFIGPQLMVDSQKPLYIGAMITYIASNILAIILLLYARYRMLKSNKKLLSKPTEKLMNIEDITDRQNVNFIYRL